MRPMTSLLLGLLAFPALLFVLGFIGPYLATDSCVEADLVSRDPASTDLIVLVHGMVPKQARWDLLASTLEPKGHLLRLHYNAAKWSNASPDKIAAGIAVQIEAALTKTGASRVVIVAHSMGALLTRRAILDARGSEWVKRVKRLVLLAGVNRGWNLSGDRLADQDSLNHLSMRLGTWGAHMLNISSLVFSFDRGAPFVANLRLQWMTWVRDPGTPRIEVVQMLGDIDDVVSRDDNEDLRVTASAHHFAQLLVRGTGHGDIVDFGADAEPGSEQARLGAYRRDKVIMAATAEFETVQTYNEVLPYTTNSKITELVFVLHGIRDLGRWSAKFESEIDRRYPGRREHLAIVSPRYGYFGMGPFLFEGVRKRYVRWFMDEYTETLARYPNVTPANIRFFGHSNGTYIAAEALKTYKAMEIERVVFAGSVVAKDFDWAGLTTLDPVTGQERPRVQAVRNYVGTEDWVVAMFPRLFELPVASWLKNPIGSAGFNGFDDAARVDNVRFVQGAHSAFESRVDEIVEYLLGSGSAQKAKQEERSWWGELLSAWPLVVVIWLGLVYLVLGLGTRIVAASPQPVWPALLAYILVVVMILRTV